MPKTRSIARALHDVLGLDPADDQSWMRAGTEAREEDVVSDKRLEQARIVLFATHGLVTDEVVRSAGLNEPALLLSPPTIKKPEDGQDGLLTAREIVRLNLKAEWVVLSACNSASGDGTPNGEALSGLADAFLAAGARGVIVSHWQVDPVIATQFLRRLFLEWGNGKRRMDEALTLAMQALRNGDIFTGAALRTEYQWAPFVVVSR